MKAVQRRVLVVEDDEDSRTLFRELLADSEIGAVCVDHEALPEPDGFSLVVTDLPGSRAPYSSADAGRWVSRMGSRYLAPVMVVTGRAEATRDAELLRTAAHVLPKPIDIADFIDRVKTAIAGRALAGPAFHEQVQAERDEQERYEHRLEP